MVLIFYLMEHFTYCFICDGLKLIVYLTITAQNKEHDRAKTRYGKEDIWNIFIASHEMRTSIQSILTYSELLHARTESKKEFIEAIFRNALRLKRLCNNLLDITRIESQTLRLEKIRFDLNELISSVIKDFVNQRDNAGHGGPENVKVSFNPHGHVFVKADKDLIAQVISNLLDNALKFTPTGIISISVRKNDKGKALVKVKDTGSGIDQKILPKLFSKFTTVSSTGTGIGLYISKCVIKAHGGKIWAKNNPNGIGTCFTFEIPVLD